MGAEQSNRRPSQSSPQLRQTNQQQPTQPQQQNRNQAAEEQVDTLRRVVEENRTLSRKVTSLELKIKSLETQFDNIKNELDNCRNFEKQQSNVKVFLIIGILLLITGISIGTQINSHWESSSPVTVDQASTPSVDIPKAISEKTNNSSLRNVLEDTLLPQKTRESLKESAMLNIIDESQPTVFELKTEPPKVWYFVCVIVVLWYLAMTGNRDRNVRIGRSFDIQSRWFNNRRQRMIRY